MSVTLSTLQLHPGDSIRLTCGDCEYNVIADRKTGELHFYQCAGLPVAVGEKESLGSILALVEHKHGCTIDEIRSDDRQTHLVKARREIANRLRAQKYSTKRIGKVICRDHSTVIHLLKGAA